MLPYKPQGCSAKFHMPAGPVPDMIRQPAAIAWIYLDPVLRRDDDAGIKQMFLSTIKPVLSLHSQCITDFLKAAGELFSQTNSTSRFDLFLLTGSDFTSDEDGYPDLLD